jgi:hypothetical protein
MSTTLKPGQPAPKSGVYDMLGPRGGHTGEQVVSTQHKPLPTDAQARSELRTREAGASSTTPQKIRCGRRAIERVVHR